MEDLFTTQLSVNHQKVNYHVVFKDEQYYFLPNGEEGKDSFSLRREHDEWHEQKGLSYEVRKQAIDALEKYLLKQH